MKTAKWGMLALLATWGMVASAQQQSQQTSSQTQSSKQEDALAAAARRAREEKKQQPKAAKVFDNDNIPTTPGSISVVGQARSAEGAGAAPQKVGATPTTTAGTGAGPANAEKGDADAQKAELEKELAVAKQNLQSLQTDLDIANRKFALDQQSYYGKPNFSADTEGAAALKVEESLIASKKQEVAEAQKKVDDLAAKLKELQGGLAKPSTPSE